MTELVSFVKKIADIFLKPQVHRCVIRKKKKQEIKLSFGFENLNE